MRGGETLIGCLSHPPQLGDLACNPGMCPDWELNQPPFGLQINAQSIEPHQAGPWLLFEIAAYYAVLSHAETSLII